MAENKNAKTPADDGQPVAWISEGGDVSRSKRYMDEMGFKCNPLYTAPRQWQGLTDEEREQFRRWAHPDMIEAIELRLQERNT